MNNFATWKELIETAASASAGGSFQPPAIDCSPLPAAEEPEAPCFGPVAENAAKILENDILADAALKIQEENYEYAIAEIELVCQLNSDSEDGRRLRRQAEAELERNQRAPHSLLDQLLRLWKKVKCVITQKFLRKRILPVETAGEIV